MPDILFFNEVKEADFPTIGEKGKKLSMLAKAGYRVPPGFIVTKNALDKLISRKDLQNNISELYKTSPELLKEKTNNLQKLLKNQQFPEEISDEITDAYLSLSVSLDKPTVASLLTSEEVFAAVRNSSSFSLFSQKTILNIKGRENLFKSILECYADNFREDNISKTKDKNDISSAVIIQRMVDADKSGSAFTSNSDLIITACFGLGEGLNSGFVFPDTYVIDKGSMALKGVKVGDKNYAFNRDSETETTVKQELGEKSRQQVLEDKEISEIAGQLRKITGFFGTEQKIEWSMKKGVLYILQSKDNASSQAERVQFEVTETVKEPMQKIDILPEEDSEFIIEDNDVAKEKQDIPLSNAEMEFNSGEDDIEIIHLDSLARPEKNAYSKIESPAKIEIKQEEDARTNTIYEESPDDSIFSSYKEAKPDAKDLGINRIKELAKLNSGNTLVYCHIAVKEQLKLRLQKYVKDVPDDFTKILDLLIEYENIKDELKYRKLDKSAKDFMVKLKYPEPQDVEMGLSMLER